MSALKAGDIAKQLRHVGLTPGSCVFLYCDLRLIGPIQGAKTGQDYCQSYFDAIFDVIGAKGTLVVATSTTQVARFDIPFVWEETPTVLGLFPEFIRKHPDSLRSLHPLISFTAIGRLQEYICSSNSRTDFSLDSPPDRLYKENATILTIGVESGYVCGVAHHLEAACGLPYVYNKLLKWQTIVGGKPLPGHFISCVRHLNLNYSYDFRRYVKHMRALGAVRSGRLGRGWVHAASYREVFDEGARMLSRDPFWLLENEPNFVYGELPFDGPTAGRDGIYTPINSDIGRVRNWSGLNFIRKPIGSDEDELNDDGTHRYLD